MGISLGGGVLSVGVGVYYQLGYIGWGCVVFVGGGIFGWKCIVVGGCSWVGDSPQPI